MQSHFVSFIVRTWMLACSQRMSEMGPSESMDNIPVQIVCHFEGASKQLFANIVCSPD